MEEKRFTYVVNPRRPIKGIQDMPAIKTSKTLKLTKEEALACMKCGPVYRKFANEGIQERVTTANVDRLHAEKFITEKEFSGSNIPVIGSKEIVETPFIVIEKEEPAVEEVVEEKVEEEKPVVVNDNKDNISIIEKSEEKVEESGDQVDDNTDTEDNINESSDSEAKPEDEENSDELKEIKDNQQKITVDYSNNRRKKKKHRNN